MDGQKNSQVSQNREMTSGEVVIRVEEIALCSIVFMAPDLIFYQLGVPNAPAVVPSFVRLLLP